MTVFSPERVTPIAPSCLDDLPEHRREALLWKHALVLDYEGVEDDVLYRAQQSCPWRYPGSGVTDFQAVFADDGRYHLMLGERVVCGETLRIPGKPPPGQVCHEQWCYWWTDGTRYRIQPPQGLSDPFIGSDTLTTHWSFQLTDTIAAPEQVPPRQRCPTEAARGVWPAYRGPNTVIGQLRARPAAERGLACHACRQGPATAVDHDHLTGLVRGMLCRNCNAKVDNCPHLSGCPWADYLNFPPAAPLQLMYPQKWKNPTANHRSRVELLGFDPFDPPPNARVLRR